MPREIGPAEELPDPFRHLAGRLVRERDRQDLPGGHAAFPDQVRDPMREGAGLARTGAGDDQDGALRLEDGLPLDVVEAFEQGGCDAHMTMLARARDHDRPECLTWTFGRCRSACSRVTVNGMQERSSVRAVIRAFGFGCLMAAAGLAGYVAWLLWGTGLETARAQDQLRTEITRRSSSTRHHPDRNDISRERRTPRWSSPPSRSTSSSSRGRMPTIGRTSGRTRSRRVRLTIRIRPIRGTAPAASGSRDTARPTSIRSSTSSRSARVTRSSSSPSTGPTRTRSIGTSSCRKPARVPCWNRPAGRPWC